MRLPHTGLPALLRVGSTLHIRLTDKETGFLQI